MGNILYILKAKNFQGLCRALVIHTSLYGRMLRFVEFEVLPGLVFEQYVSKNIFPAHVNCI